MEAFEDKEVCAKCGGKCCIKSGCDCSTKDFESIKFDALLESLNTGKYSITSYCDFYPTRNGMVNVPFLYIRARNEGKGVVDLFSFKTRCANLSPGGCNFSSEERPSGGKNLIPREHGLCEHQVDPIEIVNTWRNYQNTLKKLVRHFTGKTVMEVYSEDVTDLFYKVLTKDFKGAVPAEVYDIAEILPMLYQCYPEEYEIARKKSAGSPAIWK